MTQVELRRLLTRFTPPRTLPLEPIDEHHDAEESDEGKKLTLGGIPCIGRGVRRPHDDRTNPLDEVLRNEHNPRRRGPLGYGKETRC